MNVRWRDARALLRATPEIARVGFAQALAYRAEMIIWILTASLPLVMLALWNAVAASQPIAGMNSGDIARYFTATLVVRQLTGAWVIWEMTWEIRTGSLSPKLLRPVHPLWLSAFQTLAAIPFRVAVLVPLVAALWLWRPEVAPDLSLGRWAWFAVSVALAWWIAFLAQALFAAAAFWIDQSLGLFGLWFGLYNVFSGYIAPLALFPESLHAALGLLPFRAMLAVPVEILSGNLPTDAIPAEIAVQAMWSAVFLVLTGAAWRAGVRRYGAFGA